MTDAISSTALDQPIAAYLAHQRAWGAATTTKSGY
jgi:hypothetical protein